MRLSRAVEIGGHDAINPPSIVAVPFIGPMLQLVRHPFRVFDHGSVHVDDVETAVGTVREIHRTEPFVAAGEKISSRVGRLRSKSRPLRRECVAMDEIGGRLASETISVVGVTEQIAAVNCNAAGRRELSRVERRRRPSTRERINVRRFSGG